MSEFAPGGDYGKLHIRYNPATGEVFCYPVSDDGILSSEPAVTMTLEKGLTLEQVLPLVVQELKGDQPEPEPWQKSADYWKDEEDQE
jgi:hypothetical protein